MKIATLLFVLINITFAYGLERTRFDCQLYQKTDDPSTLGVYLGSATIFIKGDYVHVEAEGGHQYNYQILENGICAYDSEYTCINTQQFYSSDWMDFEFSTEDYQDFVDGKLVELNGVADNLFTTFDVLCD
ncbi:MAG: hypothetical protein H6621_06600 [Halobacteriovoraceae bacterium]|nr:hypothetical protein [Halobacteriovoraceae bacterium]